MNGKSGLPIPYSRGRNHSSTGAAECSSSKYFERSLEHVRAAAVSPSAGIFGPASMTWRINREAAIFLGAGRALLLQLAHPWIAAAIAEHSRALADPIRRFHGTFNTVFTMVFGTVDQALTAARRLHRLHAKVHGRLPVAVGPFAKGSPYLANDTAALRWVHATLVDTSLAAHNFVRSPLTAEEKERYWDEARLFAALFGLSPTDLPHDWRSFAAYMRRMLNSDLLTVSKSAKQIAHQLFSGTAAVRVPMWYCALTAEMLPPRLRTEFGFVYGEREHLAAHRALAWVRHAYPLLPPQLRFVGPYHEAQGRLSGRSQPSLATQWLNQFWIGQSSMDRPMR
jgi:uncharacterized protein (DUF2236 family)